MKMKIIRAFAALCFLLSAACLPASGRATRLTGIKIAGGGGTSTNGQYAVTGTIGQPDAGGAMSGGNYSLTGGFWSLISVVQTAGAPMLFISQSGNTVTVYWQDVSGWSLQQNNDLAVPTNWSASSGVTTIQRHELSDHHFAGGKSVLPVAASVNMVERRAFLPGGPCALAGGGLFRRSPVVFAIFFLQGNLINGISKLRMEAAGVALTENAARRGLCSLQLKRRRKSLVKAHIQNLFLWPVPFAGPGLAAAGRLVAQDSTRHCRFVQWKRFPPPGQFDRLTQQPKNHNMKNRMQNLLVALALLSALNLQPATAFAQGTAFAYQGRLNNNGSPAAGTYDIAFTLFATNTTGVAIAGPVTNFRRACDQRFVHDHGGFRQRLHRREQLAGDCREH